MGGSTPLKSDALSQIQIDCIACDGPLHLLPDAYPLSFQCKNGHVLTLDDLLNEMLAQAKGPPLQTVDSWEMKASLLHELAGRALTNGQAFMAADFQEAARRIDQWATLLRALLSRSVSSRA